MSKYTKTKRLGAPRAIRVFSVDLWLCDDLWRYNGDGTWVLKETRLTQAVNDAATALNKEGLHGQAGADARPSGLHTDK